ncbi:MAG TPA: hypothetical protein VN436_01005 [Holophaga sp.]|nr:hypothetical protein [Holophaga sp.]
MKGLVILPNGPSPHAIIQGDDGCLCSVKVLGDGALLFMDSVEINHLAPGSRECVHDLTTDAYVEVMFQRTSRNLTWDGTLQRLSIRKE